MQLNCIRHVILSKTLPLPLPFVQFLHNHPGNFQRLHWRMRRRWGPESNTVSSGSHPAATYHTLQKDRERGDLFITRFTTVYTWCTMTHTKVQDIILKNSENVCHALALSVPSNRTQRCISPICIYIPMPSPILYK